MKPLLDWLCTPHTLTMPLWGWIASAIGLVIVMLIVAVLTYGLIFWGLSRVGPWR